MQIFLKKYTTDGKFKTLDDLCLAAMKSKYLSKDLEGVDFDISEHRLFGEVLKLENKILEYENIRIKNSTQIELINCIIIGQLSIIDYAGEISSVYLDNCIVTESIRFFGCSVDKIEINDCNFRMADFYNCKVNSANFHNCYMSGPVRL